MNDITGFVRARLDEDERELEADPPVGLGYANLAARMRLEIKAKRAIVEAYRDGAIELARQQAAGEPDPGVRGGVTALRFAVLQLASAWSDHPDYRQPWPLERDDRSGALM